MGGGRRGEKGSEWLGGCGHGKSFALVKTVFIDLGSRYFSRSPFFRCDAKRGTFLPSPSGNIYHYDDNLLYICQWNKFLCSFPISNLPLPPWLACSMTQSSTFIDFLMDQQERVSVLRKIKVYWTSGQRFWYGWCIDDNYHKCHESTKSEYWINELIEIPKTLILGSEANFRVTQKRRGRGYNFDPKSH